MALLNTAATSAATVRPRRRERRPRPHRAAPAPRTTSRRRPRTGRGRRRDPGLFRPRRIGDGAEDRREDGQHEPRRRGGIAPQRSAPHRIGGERGGEIRGENEGGDEGEKGLGRPSRKNQPKCAGARAFREGARGLSCPRVWPPGRPEEVNAHPSVHRPCRDLVRSTDFSGRASPAHDFAAAPGAPRGEGSHSSAPNLRASSPRR